MNNIHIFSRITNCEHKKVSDWRVHHDRIVTNQRVTVCNCTIDGQIVRRGLMFSISLHTETVQPSQDLLYSSSCIVRQFIKVLGLLI